MTVLVNIRHKQTRVPIASYRTSVVPRIAEKIMLADSGLYRVREVFHIVTLPDELGAYDVYVVEAGEG